VYGTHSWFGDTIGFWDGNKLVTSTKYLLPADFTRWSPMTSNQFESVEIWELKQYPGGIERLEVQVTFYDRHAFVKPVSAVYAFRRAKELEATGHRVQHWECETSSNDFLLNGTTSSKLPGEEGFKDPRGMTMFPDLPGQSRDPFSTPRCQVRRSRNEKMHRSFAGLFNCTAADRVDCHCTPFIRDVRQERREDRDGKVVRFNFNNPHSWLYINVKEKDGTETLWGFRGILADSVASTRY
jgi:hypothetical protein